MRLLKEEVQQMPTDGSSNPSMTPELELDVNLATETKGVTTSQIAPHQRCMQLQWQTTKGRMECHELKEVHGHHDARGGVLDVWVPGASTHGHIGYGCIVTIHSQH